MEIEQSHKKEGTENEYEQEILNLNPSYVHLLDFSDRAKAEWTLRDTLLSQLSTGKKDWDKLTSEEEALLEKYDELDKLVKKITDETNIKY